MMFLTQRWFFSGIILLAALRVSAAPVIDPIPAASVPAGKSLTIPVTANSANGRTLTYTVTSSTNRITVEIHTNNPFWKMSVVQAAASNSPGAFLTSFRGGAVMVTNIGDMTFMLLRDRAPRTVDAIAGLTYSGFYDSNTIFHRVLFGPNYIIQGGDPDTNGSGGPFFFLNDEFHPRSLYSGSGQLGTANSGPDSVGSQFFITFGPQRAYDLRYTIFGQLLRGFNVLSNVLATATDTNNRPLADVIITRASLVPNTTDTAITLTGTNFVGVSGTIKIIADDGAGGKTTNSFTATTLADTNNSPPIIYPTAITNLVAPVNGRLTNYFTAVELETNAFYWFPYFADFASSVNASASTFSFVSNQLKFTLVTATNYSGPIRMFIYLSPDPNWNFYYENLPVYLWPQYDAQRYTFGIGDTPISAVASNFVATASITFSNQLLATLTNGVPNSNATNFTTFINWGDNSSDSGILSTNATGRKEVRGTHTFTNPGNYPIYISMRSSLGAGATVVSTALVAPSLALTRASSNNIVRWPAWAFDYALQSQTNLATTNWLTLTNLSILMGYENVVTHGSVGSNLFFRLKR